MKTVHFVNLTNGIEYIPVIQSLYPNDQICVIRIQSSICEQKDWNRLLLDIDYNFLFNLAIGNRCIVYDTTQRKDCPRSIFQGLEFLKYCLDRIWFRSADRNDYFVRGFDSKEYFKESYESLSKHSRNRIKYFQKFLFTDKLNLETVYKSTEYDGQYDWYKSVIEHSFDLTTKPV